MKPGYRQAIMHSLLHWNRCVADSFFPRDAQKSVTAILCKMFVSSFPPEPLKFFPESSFLCSECSCLSLIQFDSPQRVLLLFIGTKMPFGFRNDWPSKSNLDLLTGFDFCVDPSSKLLSSIRSSSLVSLLPGIDMKYQEGVKLRDLEDPDPGAWG